MQSRRTRGVGLAVAALLLVLPAVARAATGDITEFPIPTANTQPEDIVSGGDGNLWFTETQTPGIGRMTPAGTLREFQYAPSSSPSRLAVAQDGNVWFGDRFAHRVGRIKPLGAIKFFTPPSGNNATIGGMAAGIDGNLWISEGFTPAKIGKLPPGGFGGVTAITEIDAPASIVDVAAGADGSLWALKSSNPAEIDQITTGGTVTPHTSFITANSSPLRIAAGPDGNLWFTEQSGNRVGRVTTATGAIQEFGLPLGVTGPVGIAAGPDGNVWVATVRDIVRITPATFPTMTAYSDGITANSRPYGIAAGPDGSMWFTELSGNRIGRIATAAAPLTSGNLLLNPGFEVGTPIASNAASGPVPGWTTVPSFSEAKYGGTGLPGANVAAQVGGGNGVGWGGTMSANIGTSRALQHVDVAREATGIDAGRGSVVLSGLLGGLDTQEDNASVKALFLSAAGDELGSVQIGPVTRDDRQSVTTLLQRSASAAVPAGTRAIRVVATSTRLNGGPTNDGLFDNLSLTLDVAPAPPDGGGGGPPGPPGPPGGPPPDTTAPVIDHFVASPARFAVTAGATAIAARAVPRGTTLSYGLSEAAKVTFGFKRAVTGRRKGSRCVKATSRNRRAKHCTLYVGAGTLTRHAPLGPSILRFSGRIGRKALPIGAYRIIATATDAAGNTGGGRVVTIRIVKP
jgi:streptogramin lyase